MAKVKKEDTVKETVEAPMGEKVAVKETPKPKRMKNLGKQDETIKVNLKEPKQETVEKPTDEKPQEKQVDDKVIEEVQEKVEDKKEVDKKEETEKPVLEEITSEKSDDTTEEKVTEVEETVKEAVEKSEKTGIDLPENIQKVVDFMKETGGDLNDYVKLNQDYSKMDDNALLKEYYQQTKPHLNNDEIDFLMEDSFSYDEDTDEPIAIKRKKLAFKEQVANATNHLDGLKSKYYEEIQSGVKLTSEQQKAIDFFNRYNTENEEVTKVTQQQKSIFNDKTNKVFNDKFKGFEYDVGDKKFRFNVSDTDKVKTTQSDLNNFVSQFLDKQNNMSDAKGYHKSLFTAMNADAIASHFYEQGKADGLKGSIETSKNINMKPRQGHETVNTGSGLKFKVLGDDSTKLRFKIKN